MLTPQEFAENESFRRWVFNPTPDDTRYWTDYLSRHPDQRENAEVVRRFLLSVRGDLPNVPDAQVQIAVDQLLARAEAGRVQTLPRLNRWQTPFMRVAASLALLLLAGFLGSRWYTATHQPKPAAVRNTPSARSETLTTVNRQSIPLLVRLPDGSLVVLQPNARLRFPRRFGAAKRDVSLTGKAFFDVAQNPEKPFRVFAGLLTTEVLGTSFTINAPEAGGAVRVLVKTGRVRVSARQPVIGQRPMPTSRRNRLYSVQDTVLLLPSQELVFSKKDAYFVKSTVAVPSLTSRLPTVASLVFRRSPLPIVLEALEKVYGIPISFDRNTLASCTLTAHLTEGTLFDKLAVITASTGSSYALQNGRLTIHSVGCR